MAKKAASKKGGGAPAGAKKAGRSAEMVVVGSKVKAAIRGNGCMTSGELLEALNSHIHSVINGACERAKANKRSTVRAQDL